MSGRPIFAQAAQPVMAYQPGLPFPAFDRSKQDGMVFESRVRWPALALAALLGLPLAGAAWAGPVALADEAHINEQLIAAQAGDILRKTCPQVSARWFVIWDKMWALKAYAEDQGYTKAEVDAFLKDKAQKARVRAAAEAYLAEAGAVAGDVESHCAAGRAEVAKGTLVGQIIWVGE